MVNTVGLIGHNGLVGKPTLASLAKLHQEGSIKLVVLHRSGSDTALVPAGVEARAIDLEAEDGASFDKAVQGINILLSTVGSAGLSSQTKLLPALSRSSDFVTFIPSEFGSNWTEHDFKIANLGFLKAKENVIHEAKKANVAVTFVQAGLFTDIGFNFPIFGWDIKENSIWVYRQSQDSALPVLSVEYLGKALAELVKRDASSLANKGFQVYDFGATGKEVAAALTDIHGKDTKLVEVSDDELQKSLQADHPFVALGAAIVRKRGDNDAGLQGERIEVPDWKREGLKAAIKNALDKL